MKRFFASLVLLASLLFPIALGKSAGPVDGYGHGGDMIRVLGINLQDPNGYAKALILNDQNDGFPRYIDNKDDVDTLVRNIQKLTPYFTKGSYSHRLFFHGGFNRNPRLNIPLAERIGLATNDEKVKEDIWKLITREQGRRDTQMEKAVEKAAAASPNTRCEMRSVEINRIAALLYDTHILGDYVEHSNGETTKPLIALDDIQADIIKSIQTIARANMQVFSHGGSSPEIKAFIVDLQRQAGLGDEKRAENILLVMQLHIPTILAKCPRIKKAFVLPDPKG